MNSALKLHQKLFLKLKDKKKKIPSTIEKLLTPFESDRIKKISDPTGTNERVNSQSFMSDNSSG